MFHRCNCNDLKSVGSVPLVIIFFFLLIILSHGMCTQFEFSHTKFEKRI